MYRLHLAGITLRNEFFYFNTTAAILILGLLVELA